jgi:hypothetical protein
VGFLEAFRLKPSHREECERRCCSTRDNPRSVETVRVPETVGECVLYCDTDFVIYIHKVGETQKVKTGDYLGDLTDGWRSLAQAPTLTRLSRVAQKLHILCLLPFDRKAHDEM